MHRFMVNQIPTEPRIRRTALQLTDEVGYCSSASHRVITEEFKILHFG